MSRAGSTGGLRGPALGALLVAAALALIGWAAPAHAAAPAWEVIAGSGPTNLPPVQSEIQRVAVDAEGGTYTLAFKGATTAPIAFDASPTVVRNRLNVLSTIGGVGGSVTVSGGPGDKGSTTPYIVVFGGSLADQDLPQMTSDSGGLSGGHNSLAMVTTVLDGGPGTAEIVIYPQNVGGVPSSGISQLSFTLPAGVTTTETPFGFASATGDPPWNCTPTGPGQSQGTCTTGYVAGPGVTLPPLIVPVAAGPGAKDGVVEIEVSGGGAPLPDEYAMPLIVSAIPAPPGLQAINAGAYTDEGFFDTRAGAHPYSASTGVLVNSVRTPLGFIVPAGEFRDIIVNTPPGFIGNPLATPQCPEAFEQSQCDQASIVAATQVPLGVGEFGEFGAAYNIEAPFGYPAKFRAVVALNVVVNVVASLRSDEDYGVELASYNTPQLKTAMGAFFAVWGTPADSGHDEQRCRGFNPISIPPEGFDCVTEAEILAAGGKKVALVSSPVDCAEEALRRPRAIVNVNLWQNPGLLFTYDVALEPVTGCDQLDFEAGFDFDPTDTSAADSPAAFETELTVPSGGLLDPDGRMTPPIKDSVVELPEGVVVNAAAAEGLEACSTEQMGLKGTDFPRPTPIRFNKEPVSCPPGSKIGSGEVKSELLAEPLQAELYLAAQGENPFGSLFAVYLVIEDPARGIIVKLAGEVQLDPDTGSQRIVFRDLPPLPFSRLELRLKGGERSALATPTTCGPHTATATNTPWSAPGSGAPHVAAGGFSLESAPGGGPCAQSPGERPFGLGLQAASAEPRAGAFAPLSFRVTRPDGAQEVDTLEVEMPPGLAASLKGIARCGEDALAAAAASSGKTEQQSPSCPASSELGSTLVGAGSGPAPYFTAGKVYLAGPYKGAPLSIAAITPAVAGPFDLGTVVVRSAVFVDPVTARVTAKTDPLPQIIKGVVLRIREVRVILDRPGFTLNPTSCETHQIRARARGTSGAVANLSESFRVGGCEALGFKPRIKLTLAGGTKRSDNPALTAVVRPRPGDANIASASVRFPRSAFIEQAHIRTVCTRVQFAADGCPKGAVYGQAEAITPLLEEPLVGPVYMRSSDNPLPDVVADLRGPASLPIRVEAAFRIDSVKGSLRSTLDAGPDVPVTQFTLRMQGGRKGLLVNSRNLCGHASRATARLAAHNGRKATLRPKVVALGCKGKKNKKGAGKKQQGRKSGGRGGR